MFLRAGARAEPSLTFPEPPEESRLGDFNNKNCHLPVLDARRPRPRCWQGLVPSRTVRRGDLLPASPQLLVSCWQSLVLLV